MSKAIEYSNKDQKLFSRGKSSKKEEGEKKKKKKTSLKEKEIIEKEDKEDKEKKEEKGEKEVKENEINISNIVEKLTNEDNNEKKEGLMLTELLDINNNNNKKKENKQIIFLENQYQKLNTPLTLQKGIDLGIKKTKDDIRQKLKNAKLKINNRNISVNQIIPFNKSFDNSNNIYKNNSMILMENNKILSKENLKRINILNKNEQYLKKNIFKLEQNQKLIESLSFPKENIVDNNIYNFKLKNIRNNKENLLKKLEKINEQIEDVIKNEKKIKNDKIKLDFSKLENYQEEYNNHLSKINIKEKHMRIQYNKKIKLSFDKRQKELDNKEKELINEKLKNMKYAKDKEKELFLKRKKKIDNIMEKSKKYIKEKSNKTENDYRYFKYKEKYENNEKKLIDKIKMIKKDPLVTKEELEELVNKIKEQKKLLQIDNEKKKKNLKELWTCRSQTLPTYRHPIIDIIEEEKNKIKEEKKIEEKKKECNDLQKKNYKPPKVFTSQKLKEQREKILLMSNKEKIKETELNNKNNLRLKFSPLKPIFKKKLQHQLSYNKIQNNNNYIDIKELNSLMNKKYKKILKPLYILHPKPDKPIDYLTEIIKKKSMERKINDNNSSFSNDINNILNNKNLNIVESMLTARSNIEVLDNKIRQNQELLNLNNGYSFNQNLVDKVGKLLISSVKAKLNILSKLNKK